MPRRRALRLAAYAVFAVAALLVNLYATFPAEALAQRLSFELQRRFGGAWTLEYAEAATYRLSGLRLHRPELRHTAPGVLPPAVTKIAFDDVAARVRLLPLLLGKLSLRGRAWVQKGSLGATLTAHGGEADLDMDADAWDVGPMLQEAAGAAVGGRLQGSVHAIGVGDLRRATADVELSLEGLSVGPANVAGLTLPLVSLGKVAATLSLKEGKLHLDTFSQAGGNVALRASATATLRQPLLASALDACVAFRPDAAFLQANPTLRSAVSLAEVQLKKDAQGFLHAPLSGMPTALQLTQGFCR